MYSVLRRVPMAQPLVISGVVQIIVCTFVLFLLAIVVSILFRLAIVVSILLQFTDLVTPSAYSVFQ